MTKKQTQQWLKELGYNSYYSGNTKTLYVDGVTQAKLDYFNLSTPFKIVANEIL